MQYASIPLGRWTILTPDGPVPTCWPPMATSGHILTFRCSGGLVTHPLPSVLRPCSGGRDPMIEGRQCRQAFLHYRISSGERALHHLASKDPRSEEHTSEHQSLMR